MLSKKNSGWFLIGWLERCASLTFLWHIPRFASGEVRLVAYVSYREWLVTERAHGAGKQDSGSVLYGIRLAGSFFTPIFGPFLLCLLSVHIPQQDRA